MSSSLVMRMVDWRYRFAAISNGQGLRFGVRLLILLSVVGGGVIGKCAVKVPDAGNSRLARTTTHASLAHLGQVAPEPKSQRYSSAGGWVDGRR